MAKSNQETTYCDLDEVSLPIYLTFDEFKTRSGLPAAVIERLLKADKINCHYEGRRRLILGSELTRLPEILG